MPDFNQALDQLLNAALTAKQQRNQQIQQAQQNQFRERQLDAQMERNRLAGLRQEQVDKRNRKQDLLSLLEKHPSSAEDLVGEGGDVGKLARNEVARQKTEANLIDEVNAGRITVRKALTYPRLSTGTRTALTDILDEQENQRKQTIETLQTQRRIQLDWNDTEGAAETGKQLKNLLPDLNFGETPADTSGKKDIGF